MFANTAPAPATGTTGAPATGSTTAGGGMFAVNSGANITGGPTAGGVTGSAQTQGPKQTDKKVIEDGRGPVM